MRLTLIALPETPDDPKVRCIDLNDLSTFDPVTRFRCQGLAEPIYLGGGKYVIAVGLMIRDMIVAPHELG